MALAASVRAQPEPPVPGWQLVAGGEVLPWTPPRRVPPDSAEAAAALVLAHLQAEGHVLARIDSAGFRDGRPTVYASPGEAARVASVSFEGFTTLDAASLADAMETRPGRRFRRETLERDLAALLVRYERLGFPLARLRPELTLDPETEPPGLAVHIVAEEGATYDFAGLELDGGRATSARFAARVAGLHPGAPLAPYDPEGIRRSLEATGLFEEVGPPTLALTDSGAVVRIHVEEGPPGTFDLVLGYLPGSAGQDGSFVGNGLLELRNLFGGGRRLRLRLVRNPGLVSSVDARVADPFVFGLPLSAEARFEGYNQDSTFARQRYRLEGGYRLAPGLELIATASRENVEPGIYGARLVNGRPRVAKSSALFGGVGVRYRRVDRPANPRRGLVLEALAEQGFKQREVPDADSAGLTQPVDLRQQRLIATGRLFVPTLRRQVLALGGEASVLLGGRAAGDDEAAIYDEGDLFRFGGANSLRGYDEDRFFGTTVARALAEYRYQLDRTSYAFLFVDVGYVERPALPDFEASREVLPGYGFGIQYRTPLGLVTVTYAINPDLGVGQGKVHAGLSFGL